MNDPNFVNEGDRQTTRWSEDDPRLQVKVLGKPDDAQELLTILAARQDPSTFDLYARDQDVDEDDAENVKFDYWGRRPALQIVCRERGSLAGDTPNVHVRYDRSGKIVEVIVPASVRVLREEDHECYPTPWEIDRQANPAAEEGDQLLMPSGQVATVERLQNIYGTFEEFESYAETYGLLQRMDSYPGSDNRSGVFADARQAWEVNPLIASTVNPSDYSTVPQKSPTLTL